MTLGTEGFASSARVPLTPRAIKELRQRKQLSVGEMAKLLGISPATLEAWESGRRSATLDVTKLSELNGSLSMRVFDPINNVDSSSVRLLREILGMSVAAVAKRFRCSVATWYSYEQGRRGVPSHISKEISSKYADLLNQVKKLRESLQEQ
jgi:DNA-binding transcriptional regulator YiaG